MHELVVDSLEEILNGHEPEAAVKSHLASCSRCRGEIATMVEQHELFQAFRPSEQLEPHPGFYARVLNRVEAQARPSIWNLFSESLFAKRLAYASLTLFVLLSTFLVSSTFSQPETTASAPEAILADESSTGVYSSDVERDRQNLLVTLATYEE